MRVSSYRGTADRPRRAMAIAAVAVVHGAIALLFISGLDVRIVGRGVQPITTIRVIEPVPAPAPPQTKPPLQRQQLKKAEGQAARKAQAAPEIVQQPKAPPSPQTKVAGTGAEPSSGAAQTGSGTGARGAGIGSGTAYADYSRFTPARLAQNIPNSEYRQLAATGIPSGFVGVIILVSPAGTVSNCRIARSSGDSSVDSLVCELTMRYVRFDPARDPYGQPVAQEITYFPSWRRR